MGRDVTKERGLEMNFYEVSILWAPAWLMELEGLCFGGEILTELEALGQEQVKEHR